MATNEFHDLDANKAFDKDGICEDNAKVELLPQAWDRFERDEKFPFIAAGNDGSTGNLITKVECRINFSTKVAFWVSALRERKLMS